ncbi:ADP-ribosyltransferase [Inquilinus sp. Marseille-Q2685]|uniref:ADP-ribosyltransferase n=1 Tax=Inquilinus sp. Marseille-Q2685 TaxID=2866581 RepID=UPI001CE3E726|nr:ADP-ribosyltransferase [Inquilinus sp. Marseille-Q2685]
MPSERFKRWLEAVCQIPFQAELDQPGQAHPTQPGAAGSADPQHAQPAGLDLAGRIGSRFAQARNRAQALEAAHQAITFITTNSNSINIPLREGRLTPELIRFRNAADYAIQNASDYGALRQLDRRVDFSLEFLQRILQDQELTDAAFTSTSAMPMDPSVDSPFRNTLLHIQARWAADVSGLSPNPHFQEHLLPSNSRFKILKGHIDRRDDADTDYSQPFKAELWLEQIEPTQASIVGDPWKRRQR